MTKGERQFLAAFAKIANPRTWRVTKDGSIRHRTGHCPLSWVAHLVDKTITTCEVNRPAEVLGLTEIMTERILNAADFGSQSRLRKLMVAAIR